jgi:perosamine synthetase
VALLGRQQLAAYSPLSPGAFSGALASFALRDSTNVERARSLVSAEFHAEETLLLDSARSALRVASEMSLPAAPKRLVALPAFQCFEVATAAVGADCRIALYDVDPATLRPDLESMERALRNGAAAVVVAPLYGLPVDWDAIVDLTTRHGAVAIEDAAQGSGAEWKGHRVGSLGRLSVVSFGRGKGWTGGGGGALLVRGKDAARTELLESLTRQSARTETRVATTAMLQLLFGRPSLYGIPFGIPSLGLGETRYHEPTPPRSITEFSAALLRRTADAARREVGVRQRNASHWNAALPRDVLRGAPPVISGGKGGYLRYPLRLTSEAAERATTAAGRRAGITRSYPRPLSELEAVAPRLVAPTIRYPGAETLARELVTLPTHSLLGGDDRRAIVGLSAAWSAP